MTVSSSDLLIHVANVTMLLSLSVRSMLVLRGLQLVASALFITCFATMREPMLGAVVWNVVFASVNVWRIWRTILERRPPRLSPEEQELHRACFDEVPLHGYRRLMDLGEWQDGLPPEVMAERAKVPPRLWLIARGRVQIQEPRGEVRVISQGEFVGDGAFFSEEPLVSDVVVTEPVRCVGWSVDRLRRFMTDEPVIGAALQRILGRSLVRRLRS